MLIKIDECLPGEVADLLTGVGHEVETVKREGLKGSVDSIIWETINKENRFLVTSDLDFSDIRKYAPGTHPGVLLLRLSREGRTHITLYLKKLISKFDFNEWKGCLVIGSDHKIRVKKPKKNESNEKTG